VFARKSCGGMRTFTLLPTHNMMKSPLLILLVSALLVLQFAKASTERTEDSSPAATIKQFLADHLKNRKYKDFLFPFIESRSLQGNETHTQGLVTEWMKDIGFDTIDTYTYKDVGDKLTKHPNFNSPRDNFDESPVVVGVLGGDADGDFDPILLNVDLNGEAEATPKKHRSLILNGHVDVVPIEDDSQFTVQEKDGRIYGRGSTDMKGGIYASMLAVEAIVKGLQKKPAGRLIFESVVEEESGGSGSLSTILRGYKADAAIIPEPSQLKIFPKQQGSMWFNITVYGKAAHGASRYDGVSAIEKSMRVIEQLQTLEMVRNDDVKRSDPMCKDLPIPVPINIGRMKGGKWPSSVPDYVELHGRLGVIPGEKIADAKQQLIDAMSQLAQVDEWFKEHPVQVNFFGASWPAGDVSPDSDVVSTLIKAFEQTLHEKPVVAMAPWATDAGYLSTLGDTQAIIFGPGETAKAHQSDEYIEVEKIYQCAETMANFIVEWCGLD